MSEVQTTNQRLSSQQRREAIIETAIQLFSERGFRGTTTRELAAACGVSEPVIYQHFATKQDLYSAIIDTVSHRDVDRFTSQLFALANEGDDEAFFTAAANLIVDFYQANPAFIRLLYYSALEKHELAALFFERMSCEFMGLMSKFIQQRIDEGRFRKVHPVVAAKHFVGGVGEYALWSVLCDFRADDLPPKEVFLTEVVSMFLNGVRAK
jgi:AcrR family transcriptional regulator